MTGARTWAVLAVTVAFSAACGGGADTGDAPARGQVATPTSTSTTARAVPSTRVARTDTELAIADEPGGDSSRQLPALTPLGSPRALMVVDEQDEWLQVALPERPNGSTGWVRRTDVQINEVNERIEIDLASRTLTLTDEGHVVATTPVAIGKPDTPTPTGTFYVVDKIATGDPGGAYGPYAFGLSGHSDVITSFAGGDGQLGIHGTNAPDSIGKAVSHGCIRVPNDIAEVLEHRVHLGTPVVIR